MFVIVPGCQKELPKPVSKKKNDVVFTAIPFEVKETMSSGILTMDIPSLTVQYEPKGTSLFVECIVSGVTFREKEPGQRKGKIIVSVDGRKYQEAHAAAFIIKDLTYGNHRIKLDIADLHGNSYGIRKEFMVNIPEK